MPSGLRPLDLFRTPEFHAGVFEIQDLASQLVGLACAPKPGETWWDACAGDGGKTLHLADQMQNKGLIWATDRSARRLDTLKRRAARAKLFNYRTAAWDGGPKPPTKTKFDGVLVDAPCSGVGTWQRNPHARWTTTPEDVRELAAAQRSLLEHVVGSLKVGGRLMYAICTLTRSETVAVAEAFTVAHPELEAWPVFGNVAGVGDPGPGSATPATRAPTTLTLWPQDLNATGCFWRRGGGSNELPDHSSSRSIRTHPAVNYPPFVSHLYASGIQISSRALIAAICFRVLIKSECRVTEVLPFVKSPVLIDRMRWNLAGRNRF